MQLIKSILLGFAVLLLFVGNIGIDVFKHICEEDGVSVAYVINTIDHCEEHIEDLPPCCEDQQKDDCCDDEVAYYQLKLDYFEQFQQQQFPLVFWADFSFDDIQVPANISETRYFANNDPPPIQLSRRLSLIQSYLI